MKSRNDTDKISLKEAIRLSLRGYKVWWNAYPMMLVSTALLAVVQALTPYVGIYLSARIIDEIAGGRDHDVLTRLVVTILISAAVLALVSAGLSRWKNCQHAGQWHKRSKFYTDKLLSMDFCSVDDPHTHDILSQIKQNDNWSGWGLSRLIWGFDSLFKSVFTIAGAVVLTVTLFTTRVPEEAGPVSVLNNPLFIAGIIAVMLVVTFISPLLSNKAESYWASISEHM